MADTEKLRNLASNRTFSRILKMKVENCRRKNETVWSSQANQMDREPTLSVFNAVSDNATRSYNRQCANFMKSPAISVKSCHRIQNCSEHGFSNC